MKALVRDAETRGVALVERDTPKPGPGEALLRVRRAGICGTDLEILNGYLSHDIRHEGPDSCRRAW